MMRLLASAAVIAPMAAQAADWDVDTARILGDPAFLPLHGQVSGEFSYSYSAQTYDFSNSLQPGTGGYSHNSWDKSQNLFSPSLSYGITDDITVSANLNWGNLRSVDHYTFDELLIGSAKGYGFHVVPYHARYTYHSAGAEDPVFSGTWRAIDQRAAPVNVDIVLGYSPDVFTANDAEYKSHGSLARGGQRGTAEIAVSREWQIFTARAYGLVGVDGGRKINLAYAGVASGSYADHTTTRPDYEFGVQTQTRPLSFLAINAGVSVSGVSDYDEYESYPSGSNPNNEQKPGVTVSPYVGLLTPLVGNRVVGEILYQHDFNGDSKVLYPDGTAGKYSGNEENIYTASVRFLLF